MLIGHATAAAALRKRFDALRLRVAALQGQYRELTTRGTKLATEISLIKARAGLADEVMAAFKYLQTRAHDEAVGDFEEMLSDLVRDVIPEAGRIQLQLGIENNAPALDIYLNNGGNLEGILDGNGGSLTNVVEAGLSYGALGRSGNRQLMVLDEPDCWTEANKIPNFTKVLAEVSRPMPTDDGTLVGCQTLMISHNDVGLITEEAHVQHLSLEHDLSAYAAGVGAKIVEVGEKTSCAAVVWVPAKKGNTKPTIEVRYQAETPDNLENNALSKGYPVVNSVSGGSPWPTEDLEGLRWIETENVRSLLFTRLELSPGLNVLTGRVNIGKSNLYYVPLRAMAYGIQDDTLIRHGADYAAVRLGLENGVVLEMIRRAKGSPKVTYRRYNTQADYAANNPTGGSAPQPTRNSVPHFIEDALNIRKMDGLDIQLRYQKTPVMLLNESASRRAKLLSVGKEAGLLHAVMEEHRLQTRRDTESCRLKESELADINRTLRAMDAINGLPALADLLDEYLHESEAKCDLAIRMDDVYTRLMRHHAAYMLAQQALPAEPALAALADTSALTNVAGRLAQYHAHFQLQPAVPTVPVLRPLSDIQPLAKVARAIRDNHAAAMLQPHLPTAPALPGLQDTTLITRLFKTLSNTKHHAQLEQLLPAAPQLAELSSTADITRLGLALSTTAKKIEESAQAHAAAEKEVANLKAELGTCPLCNHTFGDHSHD